MESEAIDTAGIEDAGRFDAVSFLLSPSLPPGVAVVEPSEVEKVDPTREAITGGRRGSWDAAGPCGPGDVRTLEQLVARYGDAAVDWMMADAKVRGSVHTIVESVLCDGIHLVPSHQVELDADGEPKSQEQEAKARRSEEICDFLRRDLEGLATPMEDVVRDLLTTCMTKRAAVAEVVDRYDPDGVDRGKLRGDRIKVKPRSAWGYGVDEFGNVLGIAGLTPEGEVKLIGREKFLLFEWMTAAGHPTSILSAGYVPWEFKLRLWKRYFDYIDHYGEPTRIGKTPEGARPRPLRLPDGTDDPTRKVSPERDMADAIARLADHKTGAFPFGSEIEDLEVKGEGGVYTAAFGLCDAEIVFAIDQVTRATLPAEHGSRADSVTAQDIIGLVVRWAKLYTAGVLRRDYYKQRVLKNFGPAAADEFTPRVQLGDTEHQDFAQAANAIANLANSGLLTEADAHLILDWLGVPHSRIRSMLKLGASNLLPDPKAPPQSGPRQPA